MRKAVASESRPPDIRPAHAEHHRRDCRHQPLPEPFAAWFAARGWRPRAHQLALIARAAEGRSVLLVAPTGGGKTLAGFLPSLIDLAARRPARRKAHCIRSISRRSRRSPSMSRAISKPRWRKWVFPSASKRAPATRPRRAGSRQRHSPPDILLTTPEQFALLLAVAATHAPVRECAGRRARRIACARTIPSAAIFWRWASRGCRRWRLTIAASGCRRRSPILRRCSAIWCRSRWKAKRLARSRAGSAGRKPKISISASEAYVPWAGHLARHAMPDVMDAIRASKTALVFVNTRAQAERTFQELWRINDENLPIALHHGSLAPEQRRKVEAAMTQGQLRARRLHLDARSRHRLGCGRSGDLRRRAEGCGASGAAHRPRQSPARRAFAGASGAVQPFRGAGMRSGARCGAGRRARRRAAGARAASTCWRSMCSASPAAAPFDADALYREVKSASPYRASDARGFRPRRRFRRDRRLCAQALRPLCEAAPNTGRLVAHRPSAASRSNTG